MKVVLVTICIGEHYIQQHRQIFMPSQAHYAKRHGYDYRIITDYFGPIRHPALICLEKQLICSHPWAQDYDFVIYIDADILIHPDAPPIHVNAEGTQQICMIDEMNQPTREDRHALQVNSGWETKVAEYYSQCGVEIDTDHIYNGGVIIWQPKFHAEFCFNIYKKYCIQQIDHPRWYHYEQAVINYEYQRTNMCKSLPHKWNAVWALHKQTTYTGTLMEFITDNYFIHLAGHCDYDIALKWTTNQTFVSSAHPATLVPCPSE
jgi:hypothetical protein